MDSDNNKNLKISVAFEPFVSFRYSSWIFRFQISHFGGVSDVLLSSGLHLLLDLYCVPTTTPIAPELTISQPFFFFLVVLLFKVQESGNNPVRCVIYIYAE